MKSTFLPLLILGFLLIHWNIQGQEDCSDHYHKIHDLSNKALDVFSDNNLDLKKQIKISMDISREALDYGYRIIQVTNCVELDIILDRMIWLELRLSKHDQAEYLALYRLHQLYPGWMNFYDTIKMNAEHLSVLYSIHRSRGVTSFYQDVLDNDGLTFVCGMGSYHPGVILNIAKFLKSEYGNIFSFRFLQNSNLDLWIDDARVISVWTEIYDLFIKSWLEYEDLNSIIIDYEKAPLMELPLDLQMAYAAYYSKHYILVNEVPFFIFPKYELINKRHMAVYPDNLEEVKANSLFYKRLLFRKSLSE